MWKKPQNIIKPLKENTEDQVYDLWGRKDHLKQYTKC